MKLPDFHKTMYNLLKPFKIGIVDSTYTGHHLWLILDTTPAYTLTWGVHSKRNPLYNFRSIVL